MKLVAHEVTVHAPAQQLYELLVDPELFVLWMADEATLDPVVGGVIRWTHPNGDSCSGSYVELVPARRVVFTYGWERADVEIPPGSTTVEIDLIPQDGETTVLRLVHRGLDDLAADAHAGGWTHYLERLRRCADSGPPGPDPWADRRVPTPGELRRP
ncbi:MAG: SRPBCC domain-containing protein [Acidimicrobiia bacterium]